MTTQQTIDQANKNKNVVKELVEALNSRDMGRVAGIFHPDFAQYGLGEVPELPEGRKGFQTLQQMVRAFPDMKLWLEDIIAEGDKVAARFKGEGTHKGELMGYPPTGRRISVEEMDIFKLEDGKITSIWVSTDMLDIINQLGLVSAHLGDRA